MWLDSLDSRAHRAHVDTDVGGASADQLTAQDICQAMGIQPVDLSTVDLPSFITSESHGSLTQEQIKEHTRAAFVENVIATHVAKMAPLPRALFDIQKERRAAKQDIARYRAENNLQAMQEKETEQIALKLILNSVYGNLGHPGFRFEHPLFAELVTLLGRWALERAKKICTEQVDTPSSGDTDALMFDTKCTTYTAAMQCAQQLVRTFNEPFPFIQLEVGSIMRSTAIIKCKKYMALTVSDDTSFLKFKMVSMPWDKSLSCEFAKWVCQFLGREMLLRSCMPVNVTTSSSSSSMTGSLAFPTARRSVSGISSGSNSDASISVANPERSPLLATFRDLVEQGLMLIADRQWDQFILRQKMHMAVHEYKAAAGDQVKVAKQMMAMGLPVNKGDVIPYIMCIDPSRTADTGSSRTHAGVYPYHPVLVQQACGQLQPDLAWYIEEKIVGEMRKLFVLFDIDKEPVSTKVAQDMLKSPKPKSMLDMFNKVTTEVLRTARQVQQHLRQPTTTSATLNTFIAK